MAINTFLTFFDKAEGESIQKGHEKWIELRSWGWSVSADSSWTKGGGASVGKPVPRALLVEHAFDSASPTILGYICSGSVFPKAEIHVTRAGGRGTQDAYFRLAMEGVYITQVTPEGTEDGGISEKIEMVFKTVRIEYRPQNRDGSLGQAKVFTWDIPGGMATPAG